MTVSRVCGKKFVGGGRVWGLTGVGLLQRGEAHLSENVCKWHGISRH